MTLKDLRDAIFYFDGTAGKNGQNVFSIKYLLVEV